MGNPLRSPRHFCLLAARLAVIRRPLNTAVDYVGSIPNATLAVVYRVHGHRRHHGWPVAEYLSARPAWGEEVKEDNVIRGG